MSVRLMGDRRDPALAVARCAAVAVALSAVAPSALQAHTGLDLRPDRLWRAWNFSGYIVLPMIVALLLYARGLHRVWSHAGPGHGVRRWQARCFAAGMTVVALALISPLDALGGALFSAHMTQHVLLMGVAAPLLVLSAPLAALMWALPEDRRRTVAAILTAPRVRSAGLALTMPAVAWTLHAAAIWVWHAPQLYSASVTNDLVHALQHGSFFGTAVLFWWALRDRAAHGIGVIYLFTTAVHSSLLGALLAFAPATFYWPYEVTAPVWGLTALEDQQIGGFIMWVPAGLVYFGAALTLLAMWLRRSERHLPRIRALRVDAAGRSLVAVVGLAFAIGLTGCGRKAEGEARLVATGGDVDRGRDAIQSFGCGACHEIRGVRGATGRVGPSLNGIAARVYIAGYLPNEPELLIRWIMAPQAYRDPTAMPALGVTEQQARDMAAYLYSMKR
jgi:putative membrane protein